MSKFKVIYEILILKYSSTLNYSALKKAISWPIRVLISVVRLFLLSLRLSIVQIKSKKSLDFNRFNRMFTLKIIGKSARSAKKCQQFLNICQPRRYLPLLKEGCHISIKAFNVPLKQTSAMMRLRMADPLTTLAAAVKVAFTINIQFCSIHITSALASARRSLALML